MTTLWSVLATMSLIVASVSFAAVMYPFRAMGSASRRGFGILLVAATMLTIFALRSALGVR